MRRLIDSFQLFIIFQIAINCQPQSIMRLVIVCNFALKCVALDVCNLHGNCLEDISKLFGAVSDTDRVQVSL